MLFLVLIYRNQQRIFPAYPGSWWNYRGPQGELTQFSISDGSCEYCDCAYAKFINLNIGVNGDLFVTGAYHGLSSVSVSYSKIYSLNKDSIFPCPVAFAAMQVNHVYTTIESVSARRVTTIFDTTITLQNSNTFSDVLVVKEYNQYNSSYHYLDYFAKNVGLIRRDSINQTDTVLLLSLEGYFIEH